jgi:hypothetical protein
LKTFYGPPNYGEDPDTDSLETQALLALDAPICVCTSDEGTETDASDVHEVTLVPLGNPGFTKYAGKRISPKGSAMSMPNTLLQPTPLRGAAELDRPTSTAGAEA